MTSESSFGAFVTLVGDRLRDFGYVRRGAQFGHRERDDWAIVHVQRRRGANDVTFNLAISYAAHASSGPKDRVPTYLRCPWHERLGFIAERRDTWWPLVDPSGGPNEEPVELLLGHGIPLLTQLLEPAQYVAELIACPRPRSGSVREPRRGGRVREEGDQRVRAGAGRCRDDT